MTVKELELAQKDLQQRMLDRAKSLGYNPDDIEPIYDGIGDFDAYSSAEVKVMWVLKEAYDDFDELGIPKGGGWEVYEQWGDSTKLKEVTSVRSWQPIMYVLRALSEDKNWDDIAWIRDEREKYVEALRSCAYININKMPAKKQSGDLTDAFNTWSDIINAQICAYAPDVIIFGNTMHYFGNQCYMINSSDCDGVKGITDVKISTIGDKPTLLINAYHPNQKAITRQEYVDTLLFSIRSNIEKLK